MSQWKKFVVCSDFHGDQHDPVAVAAFKKFIPLWKPDIKVFAGDLWDFRSIRKGASAEEQMDSVLDDYRAGNMFLKWYQPQYFLRGNHDERLWDLRSKKGILGDFAIRGVTEVENMVDSLNCKMLPYHKRDGVLKIGHLKILHGFFSGVYAARQTALAYGSCLFGHVHTIDEHAIPGLERRVARCIGSMCKNDFEYSRAQVSTLRHANGWAYGVIHKNGNYVVWQAERIGGQFAIAEGMQWL